MSFQRPLRTPARTAPAIAVLLAVAACAEVPTTPPTGPTSVAPPPPPPTSAVFVYPSQGQAPEQLDRDRYECHLWAVRESQFDPSLPGLPPRQRVRVVAAPTPPPGTNVAAGAFTGAAVGAAVSSPYSTGKGALIGAAAGALLGAVADNANAAAAQQAQQAQAAQDAAVTTQQEQRVTAYRRAITACLVGRGYTVR